MLQSLRFVIFSVLCRACSVHRRFSFTLFVIETMTKFTAEQKQLILSQYSAHDHSRSYRSLAHQYGISKDGRTVRRWMKRWDGTIESLKQRKGAGRPRILTPLQAHNHITQPVTAANRRHQPIHYRSIHTRLQHSLNKSMSLRSVQRYGRSMCKIKDKTVIPRESSERKHSDMHTHLQHHACAVQRMIDDDDMCVADPYSLCRSL